MTSPLNQEEKQILLEIARDAIKSKLHNQQMPPIAVEKYPLRLQKKGACFITLRKNSLLRGCVGSIEAVQPLILDVKDRAIAAAFQDYRFPPLTLPELDEIRIEVSRLTPPAPLLYNSAEDLINQLRPGIDGVILTHHSRRATFLPQVWDQIPTPELFLSRLCLKMGLDKTTWKREVLSVETYQAEKFTEDD
jgi:AmmeMemoRadiSam system protein A